MISITFAGKIVMAMHIVTIEHHHLADNENAGKFIISLSNGLVLEEGYLDDEAKMEIAKRLAFDQKGA